MRNLGERRDAFKQMRDVAAEAYRAETGEVWRPRCGSHTSQTGMLTSAAIDDRYFVRARKDREICAHPPAGTVVTITGGKHIADIVRGVRPPRQGPRQVQRHGARKRRQSRRREVHRAVG